MRRGGLVSLLLGALVGCRERPPASRPAPEPVVVARGAAPAAPAAPAARDTARPAAFVWPTADPPPVAEPDSAGPLELPRVRRDYCEGESCGQFYFSKLVACAPLDLLAADSMGAPVVARVAPGDTLTAPTGTVRVLAPGIVVLRHPWAMAHWAASEPGARPSRSPDSVRFAAGDTVHVLEYRELGTWVWWHRGRFYSSEEFWTGVGQVIYGKGRDSLPGESLREARREWWVRFRAPSGAEGWRQMEGPREQTRVVNPEQGESCS